MRRTDVTILGGLVPEVLAHEHAAGDEEGRSEPEEISVEERPHGGPVVLVLDGVPTDPSSRWLVEGTEEVFLVLRYKRP